MKQENIKVLEDHLAHWHRLKFTGSVNMRQHEKEAVAKVYLDELKPNFSVNLWCGNCVADMLQQIYTHYERTAPEPILDCVLEQKTTVTNGKKTPDRTAPAQPGKPANNKRRKVLQAGEQSLEVPQVSEPSSDSTPG